MIRLRIAALAAAALLVAGCGAGEGDDRKEIERTVLNYYVAFAADDGARACAELSTPAREELTRSTESKDCPAAVSKSRQDPRLKRYLPGLAKVDIGAVRVDGNKALAEVRGLGASSSVPLVKEDDEWKIGGVSEPTE